MRKFTITVCRKEGRTVFSAIATDWYGAWSNAIAIFGMSAIYSVRPL